MDIEMLRYTAAKTGLGLNYISKDEKVSYILSQLQDIFGDAVVLKGGTALSRVHLSKQGVARFSEDIDLDYPVKGSLEARLEKIKRGMAEVKDMEIEGPRMLHRTARFDCRYTNELGPADRVMVEFYLNMPSYVSRNDVLVKSSFSNTHPTVFSVYSIEDLLAKKMIALYSRTEGKDIYDVFHALRCEFDEDLFERALAFNKKFYHKEQLYPGIIKVMDRVKSNARYIGNSANHFIPVELRPNWEELIGTLREELVDLFEGCPSKNKTEGFVNRRNLSKFLRNTEKREDQIL